MKPELLGCDEARPELSARLDGEQTDERLDAHLASCADCRMHLEHLRATRRALRVQAAETVPDLSEAILDRIAADGGRLRKRDHRLSGLRIASVAAVAAAVVVLAASLPFRSTQPSSAQASELVERVRAAARELSSYAASFRIVERNFDSATPTRRFNARVWFSAPERFRLQVRDLTTYPSAGWPANHVQLIASPRRWWIEEPATCPSEALGRCPYATTDIREVGRRQPFDGSTALPTDIIVPLETLAQAEGFDVLGSRTIASRPALHVVLPYRQAVPLVGALQAGGAWREFHPLDRVDLWVDADTLFPLRFALSAADSEERARWAATNDYADEPGQRLLEVTTTRISEADLSRRLFRSPGRAPVVRDGGFISRNPNETSSWLAPSDTAGLPLYRAGITVDGQRLLSYQRGMTWLKVISEAAQGDYPGTAEEVVLPGGSVAYYQPATESLKRRLDVLGDGARVRLESNLPRERLLEVAASLPIEGRPLPRIVQRYGSTRVERLEPVRAIADFDFVRRPSALPRGYEPSTALATHGREGIESVTIYYRRSEAEYAGDGIRVTQAPGVDYLSPSAKDSIEVDVEGPARWTPGRGELEWLDGDVYRSVSVPLSDLATAAAVAGSLR